MANPDGSIDGWVAEQQEPRRKVVIPVKWGEDVPSPGRPSYHCKRTGEMDVPSPRLNPIMVS